MATRACGRAAYRIYAHENTRLWLDTSFVVPGTTRRFERRAKTSLPTDTTWDGATVSMEGRSIVYRYLPQAHTDGDIYVSFPELDIVAAGDLVRRGVYPTCDYATGGWIGGLVRSTAALLEVAGPKTLIVPGQGAVVGREHLRMQHQMLSTVFDRMLEHLKKGMSAQEMLDARVTRDFDQAWGDPRRFVLEAYPGLWAHQGEFSGIT